MIQYDETDWHMITIDWQVIAQYDNDRLISNDDSYMTTIDWQVIAQYDNDRLISNDAIWSR